MVPRPHRPRAHETRRRRTARAGGHDGDAESETSARTTALLWLLIEGRTNHEIAAELGMDEDAVVRRLAGLFAKIGVSSRGDAAAFAFREEGGLTMLRAQIDRHRCIGAGNCVSVAPTAFDWLKGDLGKAAIVDPTSVDEELLRAAASLSH